jgi:thiol-disulfide isomerase/thioredoxin
MTDRRGFLGTLAMTMAATPLRFAEASQREPRELAAIGRASEWLNSSPLMPAQLLGKTIVVNFCTYTCINWLRTLPYIRAWAQKYQPAIVMIGVHTPEFVFEQNPENVRRAIQQLKLEYPIVIDNDYAIWRAFRNQYWPALYFLDGRGRIRDRHFGEGGYEKSERIIQRMLADAGVGDIGSGIVSVAGTGIETAPDWANQRSPENFLGFERTQNFASPGGADADRRRPYVVPTRLILNHWALAGDWTIRSQATTLGSPNGRIVCRFHARDLHLVLGPAIRGEAVKFRVTIDGQLPGGSHGVDVDEAGNGTMVEQRLYQLIRQPNPIVDRTFSIEFLGAGVEAFAFTFG